MTSFVIPGKPFAKQRPRFSSKNGRAFTPSETVSFEQTVGQIAMQHFPKPLEGPVSLQIYATFAPPKSWTKKKLRDVFSVPKPPHCQRPDLDNLAKAICDGLNRIAWADDAQIFDIRMTKEWGEEDGALVIVEGM
jgi:Holliday junction resolvase RusA-like endonuclease